ncbi:tyrosine-type recombinase/integrase [Nocardia terpenica]|uniref:Site-specific integrase n=1 Tax=Nocardia terpenica TaxID=455432 RepID=A0A6G9ZDP8_9NOCA|nr:site-specific integrase [Nocardia terpenica]QIS23531.1 site-specific integrase [Nocardia terpenica]QIS23538.1 site-specific integrase [Nocardia terpenica]
MILYFFSSLGWQDWDIEWAPLVPDRMPVLVDDDLRFEDRSATPRPTVAVNRWLRELPTSGAPASSSWESYARVLKVWMEFLSEHGTELFDTRERLKSALGRYAVHRASGPMESRFAATTWDRHVSVLSTFYRWAIEEGFAAAEPFTYRSARASYGGVVREVRANAAARRVAKPHVSIKYLEADFADMFRLALRGLDPDSNPHKGFHGRELARNAAMGELVLASGLRLQEFTYLLVYEIPALSATPSRMPVAFPVPDAVTKGRKFRTTWISYDALAIVHRYIELERAVTADGAAWLPSRGWGTPLRVSDPDPLGGRIDGVRRRWASLTPAERMRLVGPDGGSCLLAVRGGGGPFTAWATVFARTGDRIRQTFEPRFPHVNPHKLRHSFAMATLEQLVSGYYRQAAKLVRDTDADAALALYLSKADPLMVLRDLLGHSSVLTTEKYCRRLDTTRIYREAYESAGRAEGLLDDATAEAEVAEEFADEARC